MATLSQHHAMRRFPISDIPAESSAFLIDSGTLYSSQVSEKNINKSTVTDKNKKSWSQRLRITKNVKSANTDHTEEYTDIEINGNVSQNTLHHSMKYTELWMGGGTMRGIPAPPVHGHHALLPHFPAEVAVVVCSCPEYLNGTKKELKKASICKKCKGSRLPLAPIGGTLKLPQAMRFYGTKISAGTVRPTPTYKSRPSIFDMQMDPYDLMRRNRLISPENKTISNPQSTIALRNFGKSSSPTRGRSRSRRRSPTGYESVRSVQINRSHSDLWIQENQSSMDMTTKVASSANRSILYYNLNPYDLISKTSHNNEFAPLSESELCNMELDHYSRKYEDILNNRTKPLTNKTKDTITMNHRIRTTNQDHPKNKKSPMNTNNGNEKPMMANDNDWSSNYELMERTVSNTSTPLKKNQSIESVNKVQDQPKRPPRTKRSDSTTSYDVKKQSTADRKDMTPSSTVPVSTDLSRPPKIKITANQVNNIKSILKRPTSAVIVDYTPTTSLVQNDTGVKMNTAQMNTTMKNQLIDTVLLANSDHNKISKLEIMKINCNEIGGGKSSNNTICNGSNIKNHKINAVNNNDGICQTKSSSSSSQFYVPMPQRKKVQFQIENTIIEDNLPNCIENINENECGHDMVKAITNNLESEGDGTEKPVMAYANHDAAVSSNECAALMSPLSIELNIQRTENPVNSTTDGGCKGIGKNLRRSLSDRRTQETSSGINFIDTMALRNKIDRGDSRELFQYQTDNSVQQQFHQNGIRRPRVPPPPPPTVNNATVMGTNNKIDGEIRGLSFDGETQLKRPLGLEIPIDGIKQKEEINQIQSVKSESYTLHDDERLYEDYCFESNSMNPKEIISSHRSDDEANSDDPIETNNGQNENIQSCEGSKLNSMKITNLGVHQRQLHTELIQGSRLFDIVHNKKSKPNDNSFSPLTINRESSAIHRLEIKNIDDDPINQPEGGGYEQKTSILINGDDCYSTVNVNSDTSIYQSSVVVNDGNRNSTIMLNCNYGTTNNNNNSSNLNDEYNYVDGNSKEPTVIPKRSNIVNVGSTNTVTISLLTPVSAANDLIYKNNKINSLLNGENAITKNNMRSIIPIGNSNSSLIGEQKSSGVVTNNRRTLITLINNENQPKPNEIGDIKSAMTTEDELIRLLKDPVEAVKRKLVPHVCGKSDNELTGGSQEVTGIIDENLKSIPINVIEQSDDGCSVKQNDKTDSNSFIGKLLQDPTLGHLAEGLENEVVVKLIENSLIRLKESQQNEISETKDKDSMNKLIDLSLQKVQQEKQILEEKKRTRDEKPQTSEIVTDKLDDTDKLEIPTDKISNRDSMSSANSYSSANYEIFDFDNTTDFSDCYQSCSSEVTLEDESHSTRHKFYQMLVDATLSEIEISNSMDDDHHYESIRLNGGDPIYEEISEIPPPLPLAPPPNINDGDNKNLKSMFEGASKYDILSYLVDAKERGLATEDAYSCGFGSNTSDIILEEDEFSDKAIPVHIRTNSDLSCRTSQASTFGGDSSDENSLNPLINDKKKTAAEIERNDSGVGSETSKSSRSKYQNPLTGSIMNLNNLIHLCEDCDEPVETQITDSGVVYAPLVCRKCSKKRTERKEIISEIVETEEKYGRDLQIILEEFYQPMLVAGLLTQEQLSAIFLNTEELLENNQSMAEKLRDALDIALEQGDDDLMTVNIGKLFLESTQMLHAFENYCVRQASASLLLANLEKEKELLRIFLRVSQMENTVLRRMNLNSFLMVPVQRVTKYPLLLARLFKVTPPHLDGRLQLKQAQEKIELHLNHMNREAKDVPMKLWRRISSSSPHRRTSCEIDMINIKLRKIAVDVLEWNHDEVRFAIEGKLLFTQPNDNNWRKGRTIKLTPVNALLVTNGKPTANYKMDKTLNDILNFPKHSGIREASLLLVREKGGRYTLLRDPLYLDKCIVCTESDWEDYFEVQEISSKDTFIFKAEDGARTKSWYTQLQYHCQGMGAWRKRRNALANIMINGMMMRT